MHRYLYLLIAVLVAVTGCSGGSNQTPDKGGVPIESGGTSAPAQSGEIPTFDVSVLPTPTLSHPTPEVSTTQELHDRLDPFGSEANCELPCYLGFTPGAANVQDTLVFYSQLGIGATDLFPGDLEGIADGNGSLAAALTKTTDVEQAESIGLPPPLVEVQITDNVSEHLYVAWQNYPTYLTIQEVFGALGEPTSVDLSLDLESGSYLLRLTYAGNESGSYGYAIEGNLNGAQQVCLSEEFVEVTYLGTFAAGIEPMAGLRYSQYALPLETTLSLNVNGLIAALDSEGCFTVEQLAPWQALGN